MDQFRKFDAHTGELINSGSTVTPRTSSIESVSFVERC
jgi:hypothetical protein